MKACDYCSAEFSPATYNNIYCSAECRRLGTNKRLADKYHRDKEFFRNLDGKCSACDTKLSRYNVSGLCSKCQTSQQTATRYDLIARFG